MSLTTHIDDPDQIRDTLRQAEQRIADAANAPATIQARTIQSTLSRYGSALREAEPVL